MNPLLEKRRPKLRRKGERDGSIDWGYVKHKFLNKCCLVLMFAIMFLAGMIYEAVKPFDIKAIAKEYASFKVQGH